MSFIYILGWRSKQYYVGSTKQNPETRYKQHKQSCFSKKPVNRFMSNVWKKFEDPKLNVVMEVPKEKQYEWEQLFLDITAHDKNRINLNPYADRPSDKKKSMRTRRKIGLAQKGKVLSPETRKKISISGKGRTPPNKGKGRAVILTKDNETLVFNNAQEASVFLNGTYKCLFKALSGARHTYKGYVVRYK